MNSPFPGMDPYLESHWRDVHHSFITYALDRLQTALPADLRARVEERVFVELPQGVGRSVYPDIRVIERGPARGDVGGGESGTAVAEPLLVVVDDEPVSEGYIEIVDAGSGGKVVTVIELLSLSNKLPGEGQMLYLRKQRELREGAVSLVEIDLLRSGQRVLALPRDRVPPSHRTTYQVCVRRGWRPNVFEIYRAPLREGLPTINVPLRATDTDVTLDLQVLIEQCYANGRYDDLNYKVPPDPPLDDADEKWADGLLRAQGRR